MENRNNSNIFTRVNKRVMKINDRRSFLGKLALGTTALASAPLFGGVLNEKEENMEKKEIKKIKKIRALGFQWETLNPFLFCVHHEDHFPKGNENMGPDPEYLEGRQMGSDFHIKDGFRMYHGKTVPGFPGHPHRGFETLTVVRKGMVDHADSAGGAGRYGDGDLQWMTAGRGLMHSEMFPLLKEDQENPLELFQIWLNLPAVNKMKEPDYKMLWSEDIPKFNLNEKVKIEVLAGSLFQKEAPKAPKNSWAFDPNNHVGVYNIHLDEDAEMILPETEKGINRSLYCYGGNSIVLEEKEIPEYHAVDVEPDSAIHIKTGKGGGKILILQGRPIDEPVVQHGPFVMNSRQEIQEAFADYQKTQFGGWPWEKYDQVHDRKLGRFAKYADGTKEEKSNT